MECVRLKNGEIMSGEGTNVGRIYVSLGLKNDMSADLAKATASIKTFENGMNSAGKNVSSTFGNMFKGISNQFSSLGSMVSGGIGKAFSGISSKISSALSSAKSSISSFASGSVTALKGLAEAGKKVYDEMGFLGTAMVAIFTVKLKNAIEEATSVFMKFDDQMRKVQAVTESTGTQFDELTAQARLLGATTSFTAQEAADAMTLLGQAGFTANEVIAAMPATLNLARASMTDLGTTANIMSNIMNGFRIGADETERASDVLSKAANATNTNVTELGNAMKYVAPLAYQMSWSLEETASAAGLLSNAGIKSSMAGTVLRNSISRLLSPTAKSQQILQSYGITLDAISPKTHSFAQIIDILAQSGISAADIMTVFGMRAGPGILAMLNIGTGAINNMNQALMNSAGYAQAAADKMDAGWGGTIRRLNDMVESLQLSFGKAFADILTPFLRLVSVIGVAISKLPAPIIYLASAFAIAAVASGTLLIALAALPIVADVFTATLLAVDSGLTLLAASVSSVAGPASALVAILEGLSVSSIVVGIAGLSAGLVGLGLVLYELEKKTQIFAKTWETLKDLWTIGTYYAGKAFASLKKVVGEAIDGIMESLRRLSEDTWVGRFVDGISNAYDTIAKTLGKWRSDTHETAEAIRAEEAKEAESTANVQKQIENAHNGIVSSYQTVDEATGETYASMIENASEGADEVVGANGEIISSNSDLIASNNDVAASFSYKMEDTDISSIVSQNYGIDDFNNGIELADGGFIKLNEHGQLIYQTVDGISKILANMPSASFETADGGTIRTNTDVPRSEGDGRTIKVGEEGRKQNSEDEDYFNSPEYTEALWAKEHPDYTSVDLTKYPGFSEEQIKKIESGEWDKPIVIPDKKKSTKGMSNYERNVEIARENELTPEQAGTIPDSYKTKLSQDYKDELKKKGLMKKTNGKYDSFMSSAKTALTDDVGWSGFFKTLLSGNISTALGGESPKDGGTFSKIWDKLNYKVPGTENLTSGSFDFTGISKSVDTLKEKFGELNSVSFDDLKTRFEGIKEDISNSVSNIPIVKSTMETLNGISYDGLKNTVQGYIDSFTNSVSNIPVVKSTLETLNTISYDSLLTTIQGYVDSFTNSISNIPIVKSTMETLNTVSYDSLLTTIQGYVDSFTNSVSNIPIVKSTMEILNTVSYDSLLSTIQGYVDSFTTSVSNIPFVKSTMETLNTVSYELLKTKIQGYVTSFANSIKGIPLVKSTIETLNKISFSTLLTKIGNVSSALDGLITTAKNMYNRVMEYVNDAKAAMSSSNDGNSNSKSKTAKASQMTDSEKATRSANNTVYNNNVKANTINNYNSTKSTSGFTF